MAIKPELGPIVNPPTSLPVDQEFPLLLANPQLLNIISNTAIMLGTTYDKLLQEMFATFVACNDTYVNCLAALQSNLQSRYQATQEQVQAVAGAIGADLTGYANTVTSGIEAHLQACRTRLQDELAKLLPGEIVEVTNERPSKPPIWTTNVDFDAWMANVTKTYGMSRGGDVVFGTRLNPLFTITDSRNDTLSPDYPWLFQPGKQLSDNFYVITADQQPDYKIVAQFNCESALPITEVTNPPSTILNPPGITTVTTPPVNSPTPVIVQPVPTNPSASSGQCVPCPVPNVIVNVSPTPVTINVPPCPPAQPIQSLDATKIPKEVTQETKVSSQGTGTQNEVPFDAGDLVKDWLEAIGLPPSMVQQLGDTIDSELDVFRDKESDISGLLLEVE